MAKGRTQAKRYNSGGDDDVIYHKQNQEKNVYEISNSNIPNMPNNNFDDVRKGSASTTGAIAMTKTSDKI